MDGSTRREAEARVAELESQLQQLRVQQQQGGRLTVPGSLVGLSPRGAPSPRRPLTERAWDFAAGAGEMMAGAPAAVYRAARGLMPGEDPGDHQGGDDHRSAGSAPTLGTPRFAVQMAKENLYRMGLLEPGEGFEPMDARGWGGVAGGVMLSALMRGPLKVRRQVPAQVDPLQVRRAVPNIKPRTDAIMDSMLKMGDRAPASLH